MDEIVSSAQHEQSEGISILPESSYDIILSQAGQIAPPTNEDPGFQEHVNRYFSYVSYGHGVLSNPIKHISIIADDKIGYLS